MRNLRRANALSLVVVLFTLLVAAQVASAAPLAANTATPAPTRTPRPTRTARPTRTPRPTATRRSTATPIGAKITPTPAATRATASGALNPDASYAMAQNDPCALVTLADLEKLLGEKVTVGAPFDVANGRGCEYNTRAGLVSIAAVRDDNGRTLTQALASHVISGCTRDKVPTEADRAPFLKKPLAEKWRLLAAEENKCGSKFAPVTEFGPDAYADRGRLFIVLGKHELSAEVPGSTEKAIALAKLAFVR